MVREVDQAALVEGQTTREEVLLRLGEPDDFQASGSVFIYRWTVGRGVWASAGAGGGVIERTHLLRMEFDASGHLVRLNRQAAFGSQSGPLLDRTQDQSFRVTLPTRAEAAAPAGAAPSIRLGPVEDLRLDKVRLGTRSANQQQMADVYPEQDPVSLLASALANEVRVAAFRIAPDTAEANLHLRLRKFWVHTTNTLLYWDVIADIDCDLVGSPAQAEAPPLVRTFTVTRRKRTYLWPSVRLCTSVLSEAVDDLLTKIRVDAIWAELRNRPALKVPDYPPVKPAPAPRTAP